VGKPKQVTEDMNLSFNIVGEMHDATLEVPTDFEVGQNFDYDLITKNDTSDDKFIYAYTVSGVSANNRNWKPEVVLSIGVQVLEKLPVGHLGHIKPDEVGFVLPDPQIVWFGSKSEVLDGGQIRVWLKGYVLPTADKAKVWIKSKAIDSISVWGKVRYIMSGDVQDILEVDLKSIDLSRKLGEGLPAYIVKLAGEMNEITEGGVVMTLQDKWKEAFEMEGSYGQLIEFVRSAARANFNSEGSYHYVQDVYENYVVLEIEGSDVPHGYAKADYKIENDTVIFTSGLVPVRRVVNFVESGEAGEQEVSYEIKEDLAGEGEKGWKCSKHKTKAQCKKAGCKNCSEKDEEEDAGEMDISGVLAKSTLNDIKLHNPGLFKAMQDELNLVEDDKTVKSLAGEMSAMSGMGVKSAQDFKTFTVQLAKTLGMVKYAGESAVAEEAPPALNDVLAEAQLIVDAKLKAEGEVEAVSNAVAKFGDAETPVVEKVTNLVNAELVTINKSILDNVKAKFAELTADVDNEIVLEYLNDDFEAILTADPATLADDFEAKSIAVLEARMAERITKHGERFGKLTTNATLAGEMSAIVNFGNNLSTSKVDKESKAKTFDEMSSEEAAASLGY